MDIDDLTVDNELHDANNGPVTVVKLVFILKPSSSAFSRPKKLIVESIV
jgi:hypothetical protein